jgi:hypothetical protein
VSLIIKIGIEIKNEIRHTSLCHEGFPLFVLAADPSHRGLFDEKGQERGEQNNRSNDREEPRPAGEAQGRDVFHNGRADSIMQQIKRIGDGTQIHQGRPGEPAEITAYDKKHNKKDQRNHGRAPSVWQQKGQFAVAHDELIQEAPQKQKELQLRPAFFPCFVKQHAGTEQVGVFQEKDNIDSLGKYVATETGVKLNRRLEEEYERNELLDFIQPSELKDQKHPAIKTKLDVEGPIDEVEVLDAKEALQHGEIDYQLQETGRL